MKRTRVFLTALIVGTFMFLSPSSAFAGSVMTTITCATPDGEQQEFQVGWDNSDQFFEGRGEIPRLYCEGGYAGLYTVYVSDLLALDDPIRWYNGLTPEPIQSVEPEPTLEPSPEPVPSVEPSLNPEPKPTPEPIQSEAPPLEPIPAPVVAPLPIPEVIAVAPMPVAVPAPVVAPLPVARPVEPIQVPVAVPPPLPPTPQQLRQEVTADALADGVLTITEREFVADALVAEFVNVPITFEALQQSGLDYEDLPPAQPITLDNGVVLTAEVADALEIFDSGSEVIATILNNPAKALKALTSIGTDMTQEEREVAQNTVVAAVVVTQVAQVRKTK